MGLRAEGVFELDPSVLYGDVTSHRAFSAFTGVLVSQCARIGDTHDWRVVDQFAGIVSEPSPAVVKESWYDPTCVNVMPEEGVTLPADNPYATGHPRYFSRLPFWHSLDDGSKEQRIRVIEEIVRGPGEVA